MSISFIIDIRLLGYILICKIKYYLYPKVFSLKRSFEWIHDSWHGSYEAAPTETSAWQSGGGSLQSFGAMAVSSLPGSAIRDYFLPLTTYTTAPNAETFYYYFNSTLIIIYASQLAGLRHLNILKLYSIMPGGGGII